MHEDVWYERLGNILYRPTGQAERTICTGRFRGAHHDDGNPRRFRLLVEQTADLEPRPPRQLDIEHDEIGANLTRDRQCILTHLRAGNSMSSSLQQARDV